MTDERQHTLMKTVGHLLEARRTRQPIDDLPADLTPKDPAEISFVQDRLAASFGAIGGWKIGAPTPDATPTFAPMPLAWMASTDAQLTGDHWRFRGLEAEVAFLLGQDLPPRAVPYTREEALAAIESCHPAVEILETAFAHPAKVPREATLADLQLHGGFIYGAAFKHWRALDFQQESVYLAVDGIVREQRTGSNTSGDLLRLLPWLANEGSTRTGGLRKGQWITTGSWTGNTPADSTSPVTAEFSNLGRVDLRFA